MLILPAPAPIAPTLTVLVVPVFAFSVTSSDVVPLIASALIAPPTLFTTRFVLPESRMSAVLNAIASSEDVNVVVAPPVIFRLLPPVAA